MTTLPYMPDQNILVVTGKVKDDPQVHYARDGTPMCGFILESRRPPAKHSASQDPVVDAFPVLIRGDGAEEWAGQLSQGQCLRVRGLLQSRPVVRLLQDDVLTEIVDIYHMSYMEYPVRAPGSKTIDWEKLQQSGLLRDIPEDAEEAGGSYRYVVEDGKVYKRRRQIHYEILADAIEVIECPGEYDENRIVLVGRVQIEPQIAYVGEAMVPLCQFGVACTRQSTHHSDLVHCIRWGPDAEWIAREVKKGQRVMIKGRLQSRPYEKEVTVRRGNRKTKRVLRRVAYEVSVSRLCFVEEAPPPEAPPGESGEGSGS